MLIPSNAKVLFIGDSITDANRDRRLLPSPWETSADLGEGYVSLFKSLLFEKYPESNIRILNRGLGGNTVRDLALRWKRDVLDLSPDWLCVKIGINDVWRQFDSPRSPHVHVLPDEFTATYRQLLEACRDELKGLILVSPYFVENDKRHPMRRRMDSYGEIVRQLASEFEAIFVDSQALMDELMGRMSPTQIAHDQIHPYRLGHASLAQGIFEALNFTTNATESNEGKTDKT